MQLYAKNLSVLTNIAKSSILDVWQASKYTPRDEDINFVIVSSERLYIKMYQWHRFFENLYYQGYVIFARKNLSFIYITLIEICPIELLQEMLVPKLQKLYKLLLRGKSFVRFVRDFL